jgi:prolyl-tRNA synthetase
VLGEPGEARLTEHAVTVRCLTRPDGSLPERGDEPDLIAWIGRAY